MKNILIVLVILSGVLLGWLAPQPDFEQGEYGGLRYTCRYAVDLVDGAKVIDKSLCVGRLENGQYFEIDNGVITVGR